MKQFLVFAAVAAVVATNAHALTIKKGQVIGGDGEVYDGASPEQLEVYKNRAANGGDVAGVVGSNVYVVVGDDITFVPIQDLTGKSKTTQMNVIGDAVVEEVTGTDALSFEELTELQDIATSTGVPIEDIFKANDALAELDEGLASIITDEIDALIEEGALEEVQAFLTDDLILDNLATIAEVTAQVEAELGDLATDLDYYNACKASGSSDCDALQEKLGDSQPQP